MGNAAERTQPLGAEQMSTSASRASGQEAELLAALRESEARYRAVFEQSTDTILLMGKDGAILDFNTAAHEALGYTREEFQKLNLADIEAVESPVEVRAHLARVARDRTCSFETKHRAKDGRTRDVVVTGRLISIPGQEFFLSLFRDITERKAREEAILRKNIALQEILGAVQESQKELSRSVLSNVDSIIMPLLHRLAQGLPASCQKDIALLHQSLEEIASPFAHSLSANVANLTPTEVRICSLIRRNLATKEIARLEHVSPATVSKHRAHIRRKLGIAGQKANLATHLQAIASDLDKESAPAAN